MATVQAPIPLHDAVVVSPEKVPDQLKKVFASLFMADAWVKWFNNLTTVIQATPVRVSITTLDTQSASISATSIPAGTLGAGTYRVSYYARITTAASVSSSLTVSFQWVDGGASCSVSGTAITGNLTTSTGTGTFIVNIDQATPFTYSTTYASNAAGMVYTVTIILESISA